MQSPTQRLSLLILTWAAVEEWVVPSLTAQVCESMSFWMSESNIMAVSIPPNTLFMLAASVLLLQCTLALLLTEGVSVDPGRHPWWFPCCLQSLAKWPCWPHYQQVSTGDPFWPGSDDWCTHAGRVPACCSWNTAVCGCHSGKVRSTTASSSVVSPVAWWLVPMGSPSKNWWLKIWSCVVASTPGFARYNSFLSFYKYSDRGSSVLVFGHETCPVAQTQVAAAWQLASSSPPCRLRSTRATQQVPSCKFGNMRALHLAGFWMLMWCYPETGAVPPAICLMIQPHPATNATMIATHNNKLTHVHHN